MGGDQEPDAGVSFETENPYESLNSTLSDEEKSQENQQEEKAEINKKVKIPPIVVYTYIKDHLDTLNSMSKHLEKGISLNVKKNRIVMYTQTHNDYNRLLEKIKAAQIQFHTYTVEDQKPLTSILKGLAPNITEDEVKKDLETQGFKNTVVKQFIGKIETDKGKK